MAAPKRINLENVDLALSPRAQVQTAMQSALATIATMARDHWMGLAMNRLKSSKDDYIAALNLHEPEVDGNTARVFLGNKPRIAGMVEEGRPAWDMRETVLGGPRTKVSPTTGRRYVNVPFRHQTPGHGVHGRPMGAEDPSGKLGKRIHDAAAKLLAYRPGLLGDLVAAHPDVERATLRAKVRLPAGTGGAQKLKPHHTTDIYAGMIRQVQVDGDSKSPHYTTFRTISDRDPENPAPPESWRHPGIKERRFVRHVQRYVERQWPNVIQTALGSGGDEG